MASELASRVSMVVWNTFQNDARVRNEAETLQAAGYWVTVHALHAPGATQRHECPDSGVRVQRHGQREGTRLLALQRGQQPSGLPARAWMVMIRVWTHLLVLLAVLRSRPDVLHAHDVNVLPTVWLASRLLRVPLVYDAHEVSTGREGYRSRRRVVAAVERCLMARSAATITTTDSRARFFARAYGIARPLVLQNRPRLMHPPRGEDRLRQELGLARPWPAVLYQGGLQPGRGLEGLIAAMARVPESYLVFVGGGSLANRLREQVRAAGLSERVHFVPTVALERLPAYTASADIGVQPIENTCLNHFTTDSNKLFEYVNAGLPVVASALPEITRIVRQYDLGVLVRAGDVGELAEAIRTLVDDAAMRARFSANALRATEVLNWDGQEQALVDLYRGVTEG
ncbi:glycosyltransferase family 4 protein [Spiribacter roseus]|uniref:glycosyltransferase family 4 protein n=1 Tax=Spiribacter roseus TaxID=1855875 RepID=UPI001F29AEFC|nr:glycosyltransferase family 4 protein [Spiribacter roseus]KAF0284634.1 glycosyl transferase family 1 [Spiribacter roseus]